MFVGRPFYPVAQDGEARQRGYDLADTLSKGETIVSVGTAVLSLVAGVDAGLALDPMARFLGATQFSSTQISQALAFNAGTGKSLAGNVYALAIPATTSLGQVIIPWTYVMVSMGFIFPFAPGEEPPSNAEIIVIPVPAPKFILPTPGGYAMQDFPTLDQGETRFLGFDFSSALSPAETITAENFALILLRGTDAAIAGDSQAYFSAAPSATAGTVQVPVAIPPPLPGLAGNLYALAVNATTSFNQSLAAWARLSIGYGTLPTVTPPVE